MAITIPLTFVHDDDLEPASVQLIADGTANGEPVRFTVDSGARTSTVPRVGAISALDVVGRSTGHGASGTSPGDEVVVIDELIIGDLTTTDVTASRVDPARQSLLGMNVLGAHRCHFRFSADRLELDGPVELGGADHELFRHVNGSPLVDIEFETESGTLKTQALWDTGASLTVIDAAFARAHPELIDAGDELSGFDSGGVAVSGSRAILAACRIGGQSFDSSVCVVIDLGALNATLESPLSIIIGMPLASSADWLFDFVDNRWRVAHH